MSILVNNKTKVVVQGITGGEGTFHTSQMLLYGTKIVAGVTPGKGGLSYKGNDKDKFNRAVPIYNTVIDAVKNENANTSIIFVPAAFAADAILESVSAGIKLVVCITEGIPAKDMILVYDFVKKIMPFLSVQIVQESLRRANANLVLCLVLFTNLAMLALFLEVEL